jgi:hypothetical protein
MYAIKTRSGGVYLKMRAMNGASCRRVRGGAGQAASASDAAWTRIRAPLTQFRGAGDLSAFEKTDNTQFQKVGRPAAARSPIS